MFSMNSGWRNVDVHEVGMKPGTALTNVSRPPRESSLPFHADNFLSIFIIRKFESPIHSLSWVTRIQDNLLVTSTEHNLLEPQSAYKQHLIIQNLFSDLEDPERIKEKFKIWSMLLVSIGHNGGIICMLQA